MRNDISHLRNISARNFCIFNIPDMRRRVSDGQSGPENTTDLNTRQCARSVGVCARAHGCLYPYLEIHAGHDAPRLMFNLKI
jgi:hypothetical protein